MLQIDPEGDRIPGQPARGPGRDPREGCLPGSHQQGGYIHTVLNEKYATNNIFVLIDCRVKVFSLVLIIIISEDCSTCLIKN